MLAADQDIRASVDGQFQELVVLRVAAHSHSIDNIHCFRIAHQSGKKFQPFCF